MENKSLLKTGSRGSGCVIFFSEFLHFFQANFLYDIQLFLNFLRDLLYSLNVWSTIFFRWSPIQTFMKILGNNWWFFDKVWKIYIFLTSICQRFWQVQSIFKGRSDCETIYQSVYLNFTSLNLTSNWVSATATTHRLTFILIYSLVCFLSSHRFDESSHFHASIFQMFFFYYCVVAPL